MNLKTVKYLGVTTLVALFTAATALAQSSGDTSMPQPPTVSPIGGLIGLIVFWVLIPGFMWFKIFTKAGQPAWAAFIPIFSLVILLKVGGKPVWWIILCIIPLVGFVIWILLCLAVARSFGKGALMGIGLIFLPIIFYPVLGFGGATYQGSAPKLV